MSYKHILTSQKWQNFILQYTGRAVRCWKQVRLWSGGWLCVCLPPVSLSDVIYSFPGLLFSPPLPRASPSHSRGLGNIHRHCIQNSKDCQTLANGFKPSFFCSTCEKFTKNCWANSHKQFEEVILQTNRKTKWLLTLWLQPSNEHFWRFQQKHSNVQT